MYVGLCILCAFFTALAAGGVTSAQDATTPRWEVVWEDDFGGDTLDPAKWRPEISCWGGGNNERQCYTDREKNVRVRDGHLQLIAKRERFTGPLLPPERRSGKRAERKFRYYTSGKVRTLGLADWRYGRISARLKLPAGQGTWPAFWMMPAHNAYGEWALSGEIDIMEAVNLNTPCDVCEAGVENRTSGAVHFGGAWPDNTYKFRHSDGKAAPDPAGEFNIYTVEWAEGVIQWLVNGEVFLKLTDDDWFTQAASAEGQSAAPFDQPFYLMLNLAVGGRLAEESNGGGFDRRSFPAMLLADWVRVEQCAGDTATGRACLTPTDWQGEAEGPWETADD